MQFRPLVPWGLALFVSAGCQSYYPNGYGHHGPYSTFPSGSYVPPTMTSPGNGTSGTRGIPTPVDGQKKLQSGQNNTPAENESRTVPKYQTPRNAPDDLGAPANEEELDSIKHKKTSSRGNAGPSKGDSTEETSDDELGDSLSSADGDRFISPVDYRGAGEATEQQQPRRLAARSGPSPFKKDPDGYGWLRGVVKRDPKSGAWRLTYSRDNFEDDPYGGTLTLADDERLDMLKDGDVILVEGAIDRSSPDRFNRPSYRVEQMTPPLKAKDP